MRSNTEPPAAGLRPERPPAVLVVDDNPVALKVLCTALSRGHYDLHSASSGIEAKRILSKQRIDLVILDILMPGMTGLEFATWMRESEKHCDVPIIFFTAVSDKETIRSAASLGNVDYLLKPLRSRLLLERIDHVLERNRHEAEVPPWTESEAQDAADAVGSADHPPSHEWRLRIPSFSATIHRLIELINDPDATVQQFAEVVADDPGLSATVLHIVNSSFYGQRREISSLVDACVVMGFRDMASVCLSAALAQELIGDSVELLKRCWEHCLLTGALAGQLAREVCPESEGTVALAGLLHGLGIIALLGSPGCPLAREFDRPGAPARDWLEVEQAVLGTHHAEVGRSIGEELGLPPRVSEIIGECEFVAGIETLDSWCVAVALLTLQAAADYGFRTRIDPESDLETLRSRFPEAWAVVREGLDDKVAVVRDRQRLLSQS